MDEPEQNWPFKITKVNDLVSEFGTVYNMLEIAMEADYDGVIEDKYTCYLYNGNQLIIEMPSVNSWWLNDEEEIAEAPKVADEFSEKKHFAHNIHRSDLWSDPSRLVTRFLLQFPSDVRLSISTEQLVFNGIVENQFEMHEYERELAEAKVYEFTKVIVFWMLTTVEDKSRKLQAKVGKKTAARLSKFYKGAMNVSNSNSDPNGEDMQGL